jgi:hypothetical protein
MPLDRRRHVGRRSGHSNPFATISSIWSVIVRSRFAAFAFTGSCRRV